MNEPLERLPSGRQWVSLCGSGPTSENGACGRLSLASSSPMRKGDNVHIFTVRQGLSLIFKWKSLKSILKKHRRHVWLSGFTYVLSVFPCTEFFLVFLSSLIVSDENLAFVR